MWDWCGGLAAAHVCVLHDDYESKSLTRRGSEAVKYQVRFLFRFSIRVSRVCGLFRQFPCATLPVTKALEMRDLRVDNSQYPFVGTHPAAGRAFPPTSLKIIQRHPRWI
jgi:hypothetical protein